MKNVTIYTIASLLISASCFSQLTPLKITKNANRFHYEVYDYVTSIDTSVLEIVLQKSVYQIVSEEKEDNFVPGYARTATFVNLDLDSTFLHATFSDNERYEVASKFSRADIDYDTTTVNGLTVYTCNINSNKFEFFVQDYPFDLNPTPYYGRFKGVVVAFHRNGQTYLQLTATSFDKNVGKIMSDNVNYQRVTSRQLSQLKKDKLVITTRIFDDVQLSWGKKNDHIDGDYRANLPFDSVLHYAGGTLALKRIRLPELPSHYQTFIELHQRSNGDAYDRTGSVFVIPGAGQGLCPNFFDGINNHPDSLPIFIGKDDQTYQGIMPAISSLEQYKISSMMYAPPVELMRFFTPFGVGHFNDRVQIDGLEWADETYYKQDVTDLASLLRGEVWIGVWIGNYDGGGHKVTLDLKSYPESEFWDDEIDGSRCIPLFNTCNVLEMAGQNYGKLFATDSISVEVYIPEAESVRLRYISTGHGGWEGGDEFNPKANTILIDRKTAFTHTPWREDCGCYRRFNPVSGNFWNGLSSSDYSRSGWCPGTATQPVYFDLSHLPAGKHTITIAIPMGEPQAGSFSHWAVSGVLIVE